MTDAGLEIDRKRWSAAIFDLDGVVTRTAAVHAAAWKRLFDQFLQARRPMEGEDRTSFDADRDYRRWVDGKPRYEGVRSFLESRGIVLPWGDPEDPPGHDTVCALGNRKNEIFREGLDADGVEVFGPAVELVRRLRAEGIATAVVSSSKNTVPVLEAAGLKNLFDERVDGVEAERLGLAGKPAPDVFVEAADRLGVAPEASIVFEDAVSGVRAGRSGGFGLVIGLDRDGSRKMLEDAGADVVLSDLSGVEVTGAENGGDGGIRLPSALDRLDEVIGPTGGRRERLAVFLDYDGTLTPIVERPEDAVLPEATREVVARLAGLCPVAVVSGRDLEDVRRMVGVDSIHYAGSHGFDIAGPRVVSSRGDEFLPDLDRAQRELEEDLEDVQGARVERKRFAVAVHFRQVAEDRVGEVREIVEAAGARHEGRLRTSSGKKILELRPAVDWHKGRALTWLVEELGLDVLTARPIYLGDDTTDEDAFREVRGRGVGIVVEQARRPTAATYRLRDPDEVRRFLARVADELEEEES